LPVVVTANDKAVEALGAGSLDEHEALVSLGTYIAGMMHGRQNRADADHFWTNFACVPHRYLYESHGIRRGMWTLSWLMDVLGPEFAASAAAQNRTREAILEAEAATVPAGSEGLLTVLDWLAPGDHPYRKGVMLGFDARHTRGHLYRSMLEAIALTMAERVEAMRSELGTRLDGVVVSGGGAESPLLMQIFADAFGVPSARASGSGGASLGAAMCVAVALGVYPDFDTAVARMEQPRQRFLPRPEHVDLYRQVSETVFRHVRDATDPILQRSYPIFQ
jgi:sugar (pentulose or hexulose) kinase